MWSPLAMMPLIFKVRGIGSAAGAAAVVAVVVEASGVAGVVAAGGGLTVTCAKGFGLMGFVT